MGPGRCCTATSVFVRIFPPLTGTNKISSACKERQDLRFQYLLNPDLVFDHVPGRPFAKNPCVAQDGGLVRPTRQRKGLKHGHRSVSSQESR